MAVLGPVFALIGRFVGKLLNALFGWATVTMFGRVPEGRQVHVSVIAFGSVIWMVVLLGIAFPSFGTVVLGFVPIPDFVDPDWVRLAMLGAAVIVPLIVGVVSVLMLTAEQRPKGAGATFKAVLKGYPYTLGLALSLLLLLVFVPFMKIGPILRRQQSQHVPVLVEAEGYAAVVDHIQEALRDAGWKTHREQASWMLRLPTRILTTLAAGAIEKMVAENMTTLKGNRLQVMLHPADLVIVAPKGTVRRVRSLLAEELAFSEAHLTWTKTANEIEDRLTAISRRVADRPGTAQAAWAELGQIKEDLRQAEIPFEEWEVLFRNELLVERSVVRAEYSAPGATVRKWGKGAFEVVGAVVELVTVGFALRESLRRTDPTSGRWRA